MASPSWVLLDTDVHFEKDAAGNLSEWSEIKGRSTFEIPRQLKDVKLLARLLDPPGRSTLCVDDGRDKPVSGDGRVCRPAGQRRATVEATDARVLLFSSLSTDLFSQDSPFFVYQSASKVFGEIPPLSDSCIQPSFSPQPLMVPTPDEDDERVMAIMAQHYMSLGSRVCNRDVLCLWRLPRDAIAPERPPDDWTPKYPQFPPEKPDHFCADVAFSFQGKAFWCDLAQGVLFCSCADLMLSPPVADFDELHPNVPFQYVQLPLELQPQHRLMQRFAFSRSRTISCVGEAIKLVVIGRWDGFEDAAEMEISVWVLDTENMQWLPDGDALSLAGLWAMEGFRESGSPDTVPKFPVLSPQDDGLFYFYLEDHDELGPDGRWGRIHLCSLNMRTRRFLHCGLLSDTPGYTPPLRLLASEFFRSLDDDVCLCPVDPGKCKASFHPVTHKRSRDEEAGGESSRPKGTSHYQAAH